MSRARILDGRTKEDILRELARRAASYVPEWRFDRDDPDAGAALALLFSDMFYETVDRFEQLPEKYHTEFLNMLGVRRRNTLPAMGCLRFTAGETATGPVRVPANTAAFAVADGENIIFETTRAIDAVAAELTSIYYCDPQSELIQRLSPQSGRLTFFAPTAGAENLQKHQFTLYHEEIPALAAPCEIELYPLLSAHFLENAVAETLADGANGVFEYFDGEEYRAFDAVSAKEGCITLTKRSQGAIACDETGLGLRYRAIAPIAGGITLAGARMRSRLLSPEEPQSCFYNDIPISLAEGGYCFGRRPTEYDAFILRSDDVFSKRGALVHITLKMTTVVYSDVDTSAQYEFTKRIIDKRSAEKLELEDIFAESVVWEYYNGTGWAELRVSGDRNPFSCKEDGVKELAFVCPVDIAAAEINAREGYYIRARVTNVKNYFSTRGRWLLPFIKGAGCEFEYGEPLPVRAASALNNGRFAFIADAENVSDLRLAVYEPMEQGPRAMYLCFDRSPFAAPLSLLLDCAGVGALKSRIRYEYLTEREFRRAHATDRTHGLSVPGTVLLYMDEPFAETSLFGQSGYWIRMLCDEPPEGEAPVLTRVLTNVVPAVQLRRADEQLFNTEVYDAGKRIELLNAPILECEVWIDEAGSVSSAFIAEAEERSPEAIHVIREGTEIKNCYLRWEQTEALRFCGGESRVYELDAQEGVIYFGNGAHGHVPPQGDQNISVRYSYGGGVKGNLPVGSVDTLVTPIARITAVENVTPMCGGVDQQPMEELEELGGGILRHRGRAVSARDYEQLVRARFGQVRGVHCFPNMDGEGNDETGSVCVVVTPMTGADNILTQRLCGEIAEYLRENCDGVLRAREKLFVRPSIAVSLNVSAAVTITEPERTVQLRHAAIEALDELIGERWARLGVGERLPMEELHRAIKSVSGIGAITRLTVSGEYIEKGARRLIPVEIDTALPFATIKNGRHTIETAEADFPAP